MVDPPEELIFSSNKVGASAPFVLQNLGEISIAFKVFESYNVYHAEFVKLVK